MALTSERPLPEWGEPYAYSDYEWLKHVDDRGVAIRPFGRFSITRLIYDYFATGDAVPLDERAWHKLRARQITAFLDRADAEYMEKNRMAAPTLSLYEVYVTDRRYTDAHHLGLAVEPVRATSVEDAKVKVILRRDYGEQDLQYLDFSVQRRIESVQPIDDDAVDGDVE